MSLEESNIQSTDKAHVNEISPDILGALSYNLTDPRNLLDLLKSFAIGIPFVLMIGMFPSMAQVLFEKIPAFFKNKKDGNDFIEYCEKRAEELKKIPEIREALKTKNPKKIVAAIKNNMNDEDRRMHQSAIKAGLDKQIEPEEFNDYGDISARQRDDILGDPVSKSSNPDEENSGIFPTLAASLDKEDTEEKKKSKDLPIGDVAIAERYLDENNLIEIEENLHKWFKEKWVRFGPDGKIRGQCAREKSSEGKPKCRPLKSAQAMGKKGRAKAARRKRREDPNPDRSGKAKNVKTEEIINENHICPICGGELVSESLINEKKDACYYKVKSRYKVWPSAYASGALVKCRKKGAKNWGTKSEGVDGVDEACWKGYHKEGMKTMFGKKYSNCVKNKKKKNEQQELDEKWSEKYKRSINCNNPKGFSQRAHCQGRKKTEEEIMKEEQLKNIIREMVTAEMKNEEMDKTIETVGDYEIYQPGEYYEHDPEYGTDPTPFAVRNKNTKQKVKDSDGQYYYHPDNRYYMNYGVDETGDGLSFSTGKELVAYLTKKKDDPVNEVDECWECYQTGVNEATGEIMEECYRTTRWYMVPDTDEHTCDGEDEFYQVYGDFDDSAPLTEAMYRGRKVKLGKPMRGDVKKFKVFVRKPNGNIVKVNFGDKNMRIKKSNPKRRKSFRARHKCKTPGPRWKARYWSCRKW